MMMMMIKVRTMIDLGHVRVRKGDFSPRDLTQVVNQESRNAAVIKALKDHGGRQVGREGDIIRVQVDRWVEVVVVVDSTALMVAID